MAKLGSFGAAMRELDPESERDTFEFFGETFTVEGVVPSLLYMKVCAGLAGELGGIESDATLYEMLKHALTAPGDKPDRTQWERFYALALERKDTADDLVSLALAIIGFEAGKDRGPSPTSADGSSSDSPSSSSSAAGSA